MQYPGPNIFDNIGTFILLTGLATNEAGIIYSKEASSEEDRGAAALILLFGLLILISGIIMKLIAKLASLPAFHLSRRQEYNADKMGATLVNSEKMASPLKKIEEINQKLVEKNLPKLPYPDKWQVKPRNTLWIDELFDTHPPTYKRINKLMKFKGLS